MEQEEINKQDLLSELGLSDLPSDQKEKIVIKMTEVILKRIFLDTMERLDEEGKKEYEDMIANGATPGQMEKFLSSKIADYDLLVQKAVENFRREMKEAVTK